MDGCSPNRGAGGGWFETRAGNISGKYLNKNLSGQPKILGSDTWFLSVVFRFCVVCDVDCCVLDCSGRLFLSFGSLEYCNLIFLLI